MNLIIKSPSFIFDVEKKEQEEKKDFLKNKKFFANLGQVCVYYDEEVNNISILMFFTSQDLLYEQFKTLVKKIESNGKVFIFGKYEQLYLTVISGSPKEDKVLLPKYLSYFYHLLRFRIRIDTKDAKSMGFGINKTRACVGPLVKSLCELLPKEQSFLFSSVESVEVDQFQIRRNIIENISEICKKLSCVCHCIVLIGCKMLGIYSKPNLNWVLKPSDLLCLIIYSHSLQDEENDVFYDPFYFYTKYDRQQRVNVFLTNFEISYRYGKDNISSVFSILFVCFNDPKEKYKNNLIEAAQKIKESLHVYDYSFLNIKATQHFSMKHFFHYCPGLIHFVYLDKMRGRIYSPKIIDISEKYNITKEYIRKRVWKMEFLIQNLQKKKEKYNNILIQAKDVTYSFSDWLVGEKEGKNYEFCAQNVKNAKGHFQLYTIYLPFVSTVAIEKYNEVLKKKLSEITEI